MIDLQKFCSADDFRPYLRHPFRYKGHVHATDGRLLIRVADDCAFASIDKVAVERVLKLDEPRDFVPAPAVELPPKEPVKIISCTDCDGRGTEHDCPDCMCDCDTCGGKGTIEHEPEVSATLAGQIFNLEYLRQLYSLPGLEIAPNPADCEVFTPLYFRFTGGVGALMPMRLEYRNHIKIEAVAEERA